MGEARRQVCPPLSFAPCSSMEITGKKRDTSNEAIEGVKHILTREQQLEEKETKARVNSVWEKMNSGLPPKMPKSITNRPIQAGSKKTTPKATTPDWMVSLGLVAPKKMPGMPAKRPLSIQNKTSEEARKLAAAALSAVRDVTSAAAAVSRGKVEITEVRDFAGEEIEIKKTIDADSKEAAERGKGTALDSILEQIKKKPKLSVLDKTKKDWGEYKGENRGLEDELDAYKKSSNQYLDRVSFLQRADLREFERERDVRLALQAKRRLETRDDDS